MSGVIAGLNTDDDKTLSRFKNALNFRSDKKINSVEIDGMNLFSDQNIYREGRYKVVFDGYIFDVDENPAERVKELFTEHGEDFPKKVEGSYRTAIYDVKEKELYLVTDKKGSKPLFFGETGDKAFASHLSILTAHKNVEPKLDINHLVHFLDHWALSSYGGRTFFKNVKRMFPASVRKYNNYRISYWDPNYSIKKDISDEIAKEKIKNLLKESANLNIEKTKGRPTVMLSGGSDSVFLASLINEISDKEIKTVTYGWSEEELIEGKKASKKLDFEHESVLLERKLPSNLEVWRYDWPSLALAYDPYYRLKDKLDLRNIYHGLSAEVPFPTGTKKIEKLDKLQKFEYSARIAKQLGLTELINNYSPNIARGISVIASDYDSSIIAASLNIRRKEVENLLDKDLPRPVPEEIIDEEFNIEGQSFYEKHAYLTLKVRDIPRRGVLTQPINNFDIFSYDKLIEFAAGLPYKQKKDARLMKEIAEETDWIPERIRNSPPSESIFVVDTYRKRIISDRETYNEAIESFLSRGFLKKREAREILKPDNFEKMGINRLFFCVSVYLLEKYLEQFIDREKPWKPPN